MAEMRRNVVLETVVDAIKEAANIYVCTERAISQLSRWCKRSAVIKQWAFEVGRLTFTLPLTPRWRLAHRGCDTFVLA